MGLCYLSVCSGIEAATVAWHPLGWTPAAFSEIEAFPRAVLAHHYPNVPCHGDFTTIGVDEYGPIDLLVGGTPCQSFSIAGLRGGLADDRGNLALEFLRLAGRTRPRWVVWENVPGVLSSLSHDAPDACPPQNDLDGSDGPEDGTEIVVEDEYDADENHAFSCFLAGLSELGYGIAYRVLDAQHFGVPQRRRRVFVVGYLGDWRRAAAVLFERHSLSGHPAPRREAREAVAALTANGVGTCGADDNQGQAGHLIASTGNVAHCLNAGGMGRQDYETETLIAHSLRGEGFDGDVAAALGTGTDRTSQVICFSSKDHGADAMEDCSPTLRAGGHSASHANAGVMPAVAFDTTQITSAANYSNPKAGVPCHPLAAGAHPPAIAGSAVRRLTPEECEALQGFPRGYTLIPYRGKTAADGPRYKALGNSMAVPCMAWIGQRIDLVERLSSTLTEAAA